MESFVEAKVDMKNELIARLKDFMEDEARSCFMDFGCITPLYVYRMWGGRVAIDEIANAMEEARRSERQKCHSIGKRAWAFCSYLFVPQWGRN